MNSITIATKSSRMEIRLQTMSDPGLQTRQQSKGYRCETRGQVWEKGAPSPYPAPPIHSALPGTPQSSNLPKSRHSSLLGAGRPGHEQRNDQVLVFGWLFLLYCVLPQMGRVPVGLLYLSAE